MMFVWTILAGESASFVGIRLIEKALYLWPVRL